MAGIAPDAIKAKEPEVKAAKHAVAEPKQVIMHKHAVAEPKTAQAEKIRQERQTKAVQKDCEAQMNAAQAASNEAKQWAGLGAFMGVMTVVSAATGQFIVAGINGAWMAGLFWASGVGVNAAAKARELAGILKGENKTLAQLNSEKPKEEQVQGDLNALDESTKVAKTGRLVWGGLAVTMAYLAVTLGISTASLPLAALYAGAYGLWTVGLGRFVLSLNKQVKANERLAKDVQAKNRTIAEIKADQPRQAAEVELSATKEAARSEGRNVLQWSALSTMYGGIAALSAVAGSAYFTGVFGIWAAVLAKFALDSRKRQKAAQKSAEEQAETLPMRVAAKERAGIFYQDAERDVVIRYITPADVDETKKGNLFEKMKGIFDPVSAQEAKDTLLFYFENKKNIDSGKDLVDAEYYLMTDSKGNPLGISGIYSEKTSAPSYTSETRQNAIVGLGWFGVADEARGRGLGRLLLEKTEAMARIRGADMLCIETSDNPIYEKANRLYLDSGYLPGVNIDNFHGEGMHLRTLYMELKDLPAQPKNVTLEIVAPEESGKAKALAKRIFKSEEPGLLLDNIHSQGASDLTPTAPPDTHHVTANFLLMKKDGEERGIACISRYNWMAPDVFWLSWVGAESPQDQKALLSAAAHFAREKGARMLVLEATDDKAATLAEGMGFATGKSIPDLYLTPRQYRAHLAEQVKKGLITQEQADGAGEHINYVYYSKPLH